MPIYDISCKECGFREEHPFVSYKDFDTYGCPNCGAKTWIKHPCRTSWVLSKQSLQKQSMIEMGDIKGI